MSNISAWELFRDELKRNIYPDLDEINNKLKFLLENNVVNENYFDNIVQVRYMAAYEQAINEFLHPENIWKQGNIKSEILHFGTIYEGILLKLLVFLFENQLLTNNSRNKLITYKSSKNYLTFKKALDFSKEINLLSEIIWKLIENLRNERNKIHLNNIAPSDIGELNSEEFRVMEIR